MVGRRTFRGQGSEGGERGDSNSLDEVPGKWSGPLTDLLQQALPCDLSPPLPPHALKHESARGSICRKAGPTELQARVSEGTGEGNMDAALPSDPACRCAQCEHAMLSETAQCSRWLRTEAGQPTHKSNIHFLAY